MTAPGKTTWQPCARWGRRTAHRLAHCVHVTEKRLPIYNKTAPCDALPIEQPEAGFGDCARGAVGRKKVDVALGADGAPCNNRLDGFAELRLMAILQKGLLGPEVLPAKRRCGLRRWVEPRRWDKTMSSAV